MSSTISVHFIEEMSQGVPPDVGEAFEGNVESFGLESGLQREVVSTVDRSRRDADTYITASDASGDCAVPYRFVDPVRHLLFRSLFGGSDGAVDETITGGVNAASSTFTAPGGADALAPHVGRVLFVDGLPGALGPRRAPCLVEIVSANDVVLRARSTEPLVDAATVDLRFRRDVAYRPIAESNITLAALTRDAISGKTTLYTAVCVTQVTIEIAEEGPIKLTAQLSTVRPGVSADLPVGVTRTPAAPSDLFVAGVNFGPFADNNLVWAEQTTDVLLVGNQSLQITNPSARNEHANVHPLAKTQRRNEHFGLTGELVVDRNHGVDVDVLSSAAEDAVARERFALGASSASAAMHLSVCGAQLQDAKTSGPTRNELSRVSMSMMAARGDQALDPAQIGWEIVEVHS